MLFKEVIGQENIKQRLIGSVRNKRISHAQLFLGLEGSGNLALALAYAQYISCLDKTDDDSCGVCRSCIKYQKLAHPDLHFVYPVSTSKTVLKDPVSDDYITQWREAVIENPYLNLNEWYEKMGTENKQAIIGKNESQYILRKLSLKTYESDYKVMIIWMPEKMNATSANKLLKILEEPPDKTLFVLVTDSDTNIISTILSRTQLVKIPAIDDESMRKAIAGKGITEKETADMLVHLSRGNYLRLLDLINDSEGNAYFLEKFIEIMRFCYQRNILGLNEWVEEITKLGRESLKGFLHFALEMVRENFAMNLGTHSIVYLDKQQKEFSQRFHPYINQDNVHQIAHELSEASYHIEQNAYNKIVMFDLTLKLVKLIIP